ncbi:BCCT family transporter [Bacillus canaveralius]|uniref:BCCT family transporter n=1 Tax=Bacillus canaveralius TaxID=1403243 RepID=A0A2N5GJ81_9BACI|nr:BCCT family transporter [Bacillus canaveralius]PLR81171.1 BCCT family transporter [Bacillus canaveralius]PLR95852.1 BCCT family transporter [Bacillus canaveralius]
MSKKGLNENIVFYISVLLTGAFIIWGIFFTKSLSTITSKIFNGTIDYFGWLYLGAALFFVLFSVYLLCSKYGHIRLGKETDKPEFRTISWLAMLFGAGTGVGIIYWSVAEPVFHYTAPPTGEGYTEAATNIAMKYSFFHWGIQPWAIYTVIGLALAFFQFNKRLPASVSSAFYPLLKDKIHGPIGKTIDILAVFATVFGIATSLGLGAMQISGGLEALFGIPNTLTVQITVIVVATILFLFSISTGLKRGIQYLSNTAMILSFLIMLLVLAVGPAFNIFNIFFNTMGSYVSDFFQMSLNLRPFGKSEWIAGWTLFYWAWWIAWAPFVGMFIARISKGRTIREFIIGVLFVPTLGTFVWLAIFGGSALHIIHNLGHKELAEKITSNVDLAIFSFLDYLPLSSVLSIVGFAVVLIYYITVADTSTFVLGMLSEKGSLDPSNKMKITWGIIQSMVASVLLLAGGLEVLQTASIVAAFPFSIIMVLMCWSLFKALKDEVKEHKVSIPKEKIS